MKFAICNETFEPWATDKGFPFDRVFDFVKKVGYAGVEIAPFTLAEDARQITVAKRDEVRRQAERVGIEISGIHWLLAKTTGYHLTSPDPVVRRTTMDYFGDLVHLCADLGGKFMVLGSPKQRSLLPGVSREQAFSYAAEVLSGVLPKLERYDVQIAIEPLTPKETDFLTTATEAVELVEKIGVPERIALHLDCKAMCSEYSTIPELIRKNRKHLIYFHLNDPNLLGPGFGDLKFEPIFAALKEICYDGWASVEVFDYAPGPERLARESFEYVSGVLNNCGF